jgi:hypothetical protein
MTQRRQYTRPKLTQLLLSETPKVWRLLQEVLRIRHRQPELLTETMWLAHYAATLAQEMQVVEGSVTPEAALRPPANPNRIDHSTDILTDRLGRLAGINVTCGRALSLVLQRRYDDARIAVRKCLAELGLDIREPAGVG